MKKILGILILTLALGLVGCKSSVSKSENTETSKANIEDSTKVEPKTKTEDKNKSNVEDKTKTDSEGTKIEADKNKVKKKSNIQQIKKQEYKAKLDNIEASLKYLEVKESSGVTSDMREAANERYKKWDAALNEIYGVLKKQLSSDNMKNLEKEELQWISNRDAKAKKDSSEMKGGTIEPVIYTNSLANTTKARCYELVEKYIQ